MKLPFSSSALATCFGLAATSASFRPAHAAHAEPVVATVINAEGEEPGEVSIMYRQWGVEAVLNPGLWQNVPEQVAKYLTTGGEEISTPVIQTSVIFVKMPMAVEAQTILVLELYGQALVVQAPDEGFEKDQVFGIPVSGLRQPGIMNTIFDGIQATNNLGPSAVGFFCQGHSDKVSFFLPGPEGAIREESIISPAPVRIGICMEEGESMTMTAEANFVAESAFVLAGAVAAQTEVTITYKEWEKEVWLGEVGEEGDIAVYQADADGLGRQVEPVGVFAGAPVYHAGAPVYLA